MDATAFEFPKINLSMNETFTSGLTASRLVKPELPQIPITVNQNCLSCQQSGKDTQMTLRLFKLACLSYKSSDLVYRDQRLTREALLQLRRTLIDKMT